MSARQTSSTSGTPKRGPGRPRKNPGVSKSAPPTPDTMTGKKRAVARKPGQEMKDCITVRGDGNAASSKATAFRMTGTSQANPIPVADSDEEVTSDLADSRILKRKAAKDIPKDTKRPHLEAQETPTRDTAYNTPDPTPRDSDFADIIKPGTPTLPPPTFKIDIVPAFPQGPIDELVGLRSEAQRLKEENRSLKLKIDQSPEVNDLLFKSFDRDDRDDHHLVDVNRKLLDAKLELEHQLKEKVALINAQSEKLEKFEQDKNDAIEAVEAHEAAIAELQQSFSTTKAESDKKHTSLLLRVEHAESDANHLQQKLNTMETESQQLHLNFKLQSDELAKTEQRLRESLDQFRSVNVDKNSLYFKLERLTTELDLAYYTAKTLREKLSIAESRQQVEDQKNEALEQKIQRYHAQYNSLKNDLRERDSHIKHLKACTVEQETELDTAHKDLEDSTAETARIAEELSTTRKMLDEETARMKRLTDKSQEEVRKQKIRNFVVNGKADVKSRKNQTLRRQLSEATKAKDANRTQVERLYAIIQDKNNTADTLHRQVESLEAQLQTCQAEVIASNSLHEVEVSKAERQSQAAEDEIWSLKADLQGMAEVVILEQSRARTLEIQLNDLNSQIETAEEEIDRLKQRVNESITMEVDVGWEMHGLARRLIAAGGLYSEVYGHGNAEHEQLPASAIDEEAEADQKPNADMISHLLRSAIKDIEDQEEAETIRQGSNVEDEEEKESRAEGMGEAAVLTVAEKVDE